MCGSAARKRAERRQQELIELQTMLSKTSISSSRPASVHAPAPEQLRNIPITSPTVALSQAQAQPSHPPPSYASSTARDHVARVGDDSRARTDAKPSDKEALARATDNTQGGYYDGPSNPLQLQDHSKVSAAAMAYRSAPPTVIFTPPASHPASVISREDANDSEPTFYTAPAGGAALTAATLQHAQAQSARAASLVAPLSARKQAKCERKEQKHALKWERKELKHAAKALRWHRRGCQQNACWCRQTGACYQSPFGGALMPQQNLDALVR